WATSAPTSRKSPSASSRSCTVEAGPMIHLPSLRRFTKTDSGTATIEFVVAIPMFLAALAFAFEFGQIFLAHQGTVDNVRAAARYLSRVDLTNDAKLCAE